MRVHELIDNYERQKSGTRNGSRQSNFCRDKRSMIPKKAEKYRSLGLPVHLPQTFEGR